MSKLKKLVSVILVVTMLMTVAPVSMFASAYAPAYTPYDGENPSYTYTPFYVDTSATDEVIRIANTSNKFTAGTDVVKATPSGIPEANALTAAAYAGESLELPDVVVKFVGRDPSTVETPTASAINGSCTGLGVGSPTKTTETIDGKTAYVYSWKLNEQGTATDDSDILWTINYTMGDESLVTYAYMHVEAALRQSGALYYIWVSGNLTNKKLYAAWILTFQGRNVYSEGFIDNSDTSGLDRGYLNFTSGAYDSGGEALLGCGQSNEDDFGTGDTAFAKQDTSNGTMVRWYKKLTWGDSNGGTPLTGYDKNRPVSKVYMDIGEGETAETLNLRQMYMSGESSRNDYIGFNSEYWATTYSNDQSINDWQYNSSPPAGFQFKDVVIGQSSGYTAGTVLTRTASANQALLYNAGEWAMIRYTGSTMSVGSYNYALGNALYADSGDESAYFETGMSVHFEVYDTTDLYNVFVGILKGTGSYTTSLHGTTTVTFNKGMNPRPTQFSSGYDSFAQKMQNAGVILQTPDTTQSAVNTATSELIAAYNALVKSSADTVTVNVNHYATGTTTQVAPTESRSDVPAGATVTGYALSAITGYTLPTTTVKQVTVDGTVNPVEITFYYEPASYNITVYANNDVNGDGMSDSADTVIYRGIAYGATYDTTSIYSDLGTKQYYSIEGLYYDSAFTNRAPDTITMGASNVTLYAKWVTTPLHIYVDTQIDGVDLIDMGTVSPDEDPEVQVAFNRPATNPSVTGYIFTGYYSDAELTTALTWPQYFVLGDTDRTVYGRFVDVNGKIIFESNGGSAVADIEYTPGTAVEAPEEPTKKGYTFEGWYRDEALTDKITWPVTMADETGFVAYANWTPETHTISFNLNNPTMTPYDTQSISPRSGLSDSDFPESQIPSAPRRFGYVFDGWKYNNGTSVVNYKFSKYPTEDITLIATWRAVDGSAFVGIDAYEKLSGEYVPVYNEETNPDGAKIQVGDTVTFRMTSLANFYVGSSLFVFMYDKNFYELVETSGKVFKVNSENEYIAGIDANSSTISEVTDSSLLEARWPEAIADQMSDYAAMQIAIDPNVTVDNYDAAPMSDGTWLIEFQLRVKDTATGSGTVYMDNAWTRTGENPMGTMFYGWAEKGDTVFETTNNYVTPDLENATATIYLDDETPVDTTINLNAAPGTFESGTTMVYVGRAETEIEGYVSPTREGYTLAGWTNADETSDYTTWAEGYYAKEGYDETLTFNAVWEAIPQPVTFYTDIEDGSVYSQSQVDFEAQITAPEKDPTKTGYVFAGWANADGVVYETLPTVPLGGIDIYAVWDPAPDTKYTVSAYILAESESARATYSYTGETNSEVRVVKTAAEATEAGVNYVIVEDIEADLAYYILDEDNADNDLSVVYTISPDGKLNISLYFKGKPVTVTFDAGDGVFSDGSSQYLSIGNYNETIVAPAENPTLYGYDFVEWEEFMDDYTYGDDETFAAIWQAASTNIQFVDADGAQIGDLVVTKYGSVPKAPTAPDVEGYVFKGWKESADSTTVLTTLPAVDTINDETTGIAKTYYAAYELADINVIYIVDGTVMYTDTYKMGDAVTIRAAETKTGYNFSGWRFDDGSNATDFTMGSTEVTITGTFAAKSIDVMFYANGGTFEDGTDEQVVDTDYNSTINLPTEPTKAGYTFKGWATSATATSGSTSLGTLTAESASYYAVWEANEVTYYIDVYVMDTEGNYPETPETTEALGTVDTEVTFDAQAREGFEIVDSTLSGTVPATGELRLVVKYQRNQWNLITTMDGVEQSTTVYYYEQAVAEPAEPTKEGYSFGGWTPEVPDTMPNNDVTLIATMNANSYTVTFDYAGGTYAGATSYSSTLVYGTVITVPISTDSLVYEGYKFDYWKNTTTGEAVDFTADGPTVPVDGITFEAVYELQSYDIVYMNRGTEVTTIAVPYGTTIADIQANYAPDASLEPTLEGNTFTGWNWSAVGDTMPARDVTVLAQWQANTYKITFNENGGTTVTDIELTYGEAISFNETTTKSGYQFDYWYYDDADTAFTIPATMPALDTLYGASEIELTAHWTVKSYTITFNANNGTTPTVVEANYGDAIQAPADPELKGNTFDYWYYTDVNTEFEVPEIMPALDDDYGTTAITLTAKWTVKTITITFDEDGDGEGETTVSALYGSYISDKPADPTKEGYTFTGWLLDGEEYTVPDYMEHDEDITVVASWEKNTYTIKINANGGTTNITSITAQYGDSITAPETPVREGYDFVRWYYKNTAESYVFEDTMPALDTKYGISAKEITVTALWQVQQHTITFDANGGKFADGNETNVVTGDYNTVFTTPADPTREGYEFIKWDTTIPATIPSTDITITAVWNANEYTITFEEDGGTLVDDITAAYDTAISKPDDPTKTGHTFKYWYEAGSEDTAFVFDKMPLGGTTLYAKWEANEYTIYINANGGTNPDGTEITDIIQDYGTAIAEPEDPVKEGNTFTGWFIVGTAEIYTFPSTMPDEDVSIEARWTVNTYDVIFYNFDGTEYYKEDPAPSFGDAVDTAPDGEPVREYYTFEGWSLTENPAEDAEAIDFATAGITVPVDGIKFYPIFKRVPVTLELIASSTARITTDNAQAPITGYIYGISTKTNTSKLTANYLAVTGDGELVITPTKYNLCGTGTKVEVYDNVTDTVVETYYIVIFGDLNGDSAIDTIDVSMLQNETLGNTKWSMETYAGEANPDYAYYRVLAADLTNDGRVDVSDYSSLKDVTLYAAKLTQEVESVTDSKIIYAS